MKFAEDILKEMDARGSIDVPENCVTGEEYEKWLYGSDKGEVIKMRRGRCRNCAHCDIENLICRPQSKDCAEEYKLDIEDLDTEDRCDFFLRKEGDGK